jgi:hypothetical protein
MKELRAMRDFIAFEMKTLVNQTFFSQRSKSAT